MPVTRDQLEHIAGLVLRTPPTDNPLPALRAALPGMVFSRCDASDMDGETPVLHAGDYDLYLVDNAEHCWRITGDPAQAGGIVIAARR